MKPQLLKDLGLSLPRMKETLMSPDYAVQQKVDGQRLAIECRDGKVYAYSRNGESIWNVPKSIVNYFMKYDGITFDGEHIPATGQFWVFDIAGSEPFIERYARLSETFKPTKQFQVLPTAFSAPDKVRMMRAIVVNHAEGAVFRELGAGYSEGVRENGYKFKLYNDCDVFVIGPSKSGNQSVEIGVYDHLGNEVSVGDVGATKANQHDLQPGNVLLVKYLYATENNVLYQPAILNRRHDKTAEECSLAQLHYTCPDVLTEDDILRLGTP